MADDDLSGLTVENSPVGPVVRPDEPADRVVLYVHSDKNLAPAPDEGLKVSRALARETGAVVVCANWRPRYPAALTDVLAAFGYCQAWGPVSVAGTRLGAGIVGGLMLHLRDVEAALPRCAVLVSGLLDLTLEAPSLLTNRADPSYDEALLRAAAGQYSAGTAPSDPLLSPRHGNLHGLPPTRLMIAGTDPMLDDSLAFATRAARSGVTVDLLVRPDAQTMRAEVVTMMAEYLREWTPERRTTPRA